MRRNNRFSSSDSESHGRTTSRAGKGWPSGPVRVSGVPIGLSGRKIGIPAGRMPQFLLPSQGLLTHRFIAHVEAALELVDPLLGCMCGGVTGPGA